MFDVKIRVLDMSRDNYIECRVARDDRKGLSEEVLLVFLVFKHKKVNSVSNRVCLLTIYADFSMYCAIL